MAEGIPPLLEMWYMCSETISDGMVVRRAAAVDYAVSKVGGPTGPAIGVTVKGAAANGWTRVVVQGATVVLTGGAFAEGDPLTSDAASKVVKAVNLGDRVIGYALEVATAADQLKEAFISFPGFIGMAAGAVVPQHKLTDQTVKTATYTLVAADSGTRIPCTGSWTMTISNAATLGNGFGCEVINTGAGTITLDWPTAANSTLAQYEAVLIEASGGVLLFSKIAFTAG